MRQTLVFWENFNVYLNQICADLEDKTASQYLDKFGNSDQSAVEKRREALAKVGES